MATVQSFHEEGTRHFAGSSFAESAVGAAGVLVAILGLVNVAPNYMVSIATLAIGAALAFEGASGSRYESAGLPVEFTAGLAGLLLGILAILGVVPMVLNPVAVLIFSGALLLGGATAAGTTSFGASGTHVLCGIGAGVLGIMALMGTVAITLTLVAQLTLGLALMLGGAMGGRLIHVWRR
jgi:hypothetical protein